MDWKTCATDVSPIVQPCRVWQYLGKSDLGQRRLRQRAREAEAFSLTAYVHATMAPAPAH
jgi:hypothetical protein